MKRQKRMRMLTKVLSAAVMGVLCGSAVAMDGSPVWVA